MKKIAVLVALVPALVIGLVLVVFMVDEAEERAACATGVPTGPSAGGLSVTGEIPASVGPWGREQLTNAAAVINAGAEVGISRHGQTIGVMTAMGESGLQVLDYGDGAGPDSRGLFQQRANGAWGSLADRMDPRISSINFYTALMKVPGWESLPPTIAAHRTQVNADPYHYEPYWDDAVDVVDALVPAAATVVDIADAGPAGAGAAGSGADPYGLGQVTPQLRSLVEVLAPMFDVKTVGGYRTSATDPNGHPAGLAADFMVPMTPAGKQQGQALADYARTNAAALGIDYVIWYQQIWSTNRASEGWRPMEDRGSPTENHLDHVHINVKPDAAGAIGALPIADTGATTGGVACASAVTGGGAVVYPVTDKDSDRENWGASGDNWDSTHTGTDFSVGCGTPVYASHGGTVSIEASSWAGPQLTKISMGPKDLTTWYAHMESVTVGAGDVVAAGSQIGTVGTLGNSTGCHLHFEVHTENGSIYGPDNVNPTTWLAEHVGEVIGGPPVVTDVGAVVYDQATNGGRGGRSGSGTTLGAMPSAINATVGGGFAGAVTVANANFKWAPDRGLRAIVGNARPDFITLNEIYKYSAGQLARMVSGYGGYKDPVVTGAGNKGQSVNNALMWDATKWAMLDGGRVKIVEDDHAVFKGKNVLWSRFATWGVFARRSDGAQVAVVSVHHMTNAYRFRKQWGSPPMSRPEQYGRGMDYLIQLGAVLGAYGPVLIGGDMNSHAGDGPNAAAPRMEAAGYRYTKDSGVIYNFYPPAMRLERTWQLSAGAIGSDHPALLTRLATSGARNRPAS